MKVLAGDIGGTHTRLAIVDVEPRRHRAKVVRESKLASQDAPGLAPLVQAFLGEGGERVSRGCLGVAGPIRNQRVRTTNLPWRIDAQRLSRKTGVPHLRLINDFAAVGYGIEMLNRRDLRTLQPGRAVRHGPIAVIGAGTGLGEGYLTWDADSERYEVQASEGGHATFAARTPAEWGLYRYLARKHGHVSYERVVSGPGLVAVYHYLAGTRPRLARKTIAAEMRQSDPAAVVSRHGLAGTDRLCVKALELFVRVFGGQASNLALTVLSTGGVYLAGGIAPRIIKALTGGLFLEAFRDKGRLTPVVRRMPVHVIMNKDVGLLGAAAVAARG